MRHMDRLFGELQRRGARTFEVTEQANARFLNRMTELLGDSVFYLGNCAGSRSYWLTTAGKRRFSDRLGAKRGQGTGPFPVELLRESVTAAGNVIRRRAAASLTAQLERREVD